MKEIHNFIIEIGWKEFKKNKVFTFTRSTTTATITTLEKDACKIFSRNESHSSFLEAAVVAVASWVNCDCGSNKKWPFVSSFLSHRKTVSF